MSQVFDYVRPTGLSASGIEFFQAAARKGALSLELDGMKRRGQTAYSICKQVYGFTGTRAKVLGHMEWLVESLIAERKGTITPQSRILLRQVMAHSRGEE